jgi:hypothetical protein
MGNVCSYDSIAKKWGYQVLLNRLDFTIKVIPMWKDDPQFANNRLIVVIGDQWTFIYLCLN